MSSQEIKLTRFLKYKGRWPNDFVGNEKGSVRFIEEVNASSELLTNGSGIASKNSVSSNNFKVKLRAPQATEGLFI